MLAAMAAMHCNLMAMNKMSDVWSATSWSAIGRLHGM
jgi:hypothetical protein